MELSLPSLTVIDRSVPYALSTKEFPIPEELAQGVDIAHVDPLQISRMQVEVARRENVARRESGQAGEEEASQGEGASQPEGAGQPEAGRRLKRILLVPVGSLFLAPPGDPSPWVQRDVGGGDCGALSGTAAVLCWVMARR